MKLLIIIGVLCWVQYPSSIHADIPSKEYIVNLDLPEEQRWNSILDDQGNIVTEITQILQTFIPKDLLPLVGKLTAGLNDYLPVKYAKEITGIANHLNISVGEVLIANIMYDATAFCTSIISTDSNGQIWHSRNMDYRFTEVLKNITITYHAQRKGKTVYTATTFAGYVGIVTGQKPKLFTMSVDQRDKGAVWQNLLMAIIDKKASLVSFLARDTLESAGSFAEAVETLSNTDTIAPVYYIVGGVYPNEGAVVTKKHLGSADVWFLDMAKGRWFLVETNYDHWNPPPKSDDRRDPAIKMVKATTRAGINADSLFRIMSTAPVLNKITIYTVIMSAAQPNIYHCTVRK